MQQTDVLEIWEESLESQITGIFELSRRELLAGRGEIVGGEDVQGFCNSTFGWRDDQTVVSTNGVALIIPKKVMPKFIVGVSLKAHHNHHSKPLTLYRLTVRPNPPDFNNRFTYEVAHFGVSKADWDNLRETLKRDLEGLATVAKNQSSDKDSCLPKAAMMLLMFVALVYSIVNVFL
ncbi:MAG: hypothetical protein HKUEN02_22060 [Anaerolineaceae bacterium]|nr:MAG: hypothetical protein HKUEN02_22060 [Anaerolineaceae bacterium]